MTIDLEGSLLLLAIITTAKIDIIRKLENGLIWLAHTKTIIVGRHPNVRILGDINVEMIYVALAKTIFWQCRKVSDGNALT